jgi:type I restriction enzyme, S subunit
VKTGELNNRFIHSTEERITEVALESSSAKLFPAGTVIIALYGATIGELAILGCAAATNQACAALFPKDPRSHYCYTIQLMRSIKSGLVAIAFGGAQQNISQTLIRQFRVFAPPAQLIERYVENAKPMYETLEKLQLATVVVEDTRESLLNRLISGAVPVGELSVRFSKDSERITSDFGAEELVHA